MLIDRGHAGQRATGGGMLHRATQLFLVMAILSGTASVLVAASITKIDLKTDGNARPPGDLLQVTVVTKPIEKSLRLEVRAYRVDPSSGEVIERVRAATNDFRDEDGFFIRKTELDRDILNLEQPEFPLIVPYAALKLPPGEHTIGYVVRLMTADRELSERATRLTLCRVSTHSQKRIIRKNYTVSKTIETSREVSVLLPKDGTLAEKILVLHDARPVFEEQARQFAIEVPGGFERADVSTPVLTWSTTNEAGIPETSHESNHPWIPHDKQAILFATNRKIASQQDFTAKRFGTTLSGDMSYGIATVNIPVEVHHRGELELPSSWKPTWWEKRDPKKHFLLEKIDALTGDQFRDKLCNPSGDTSHDILLFVHGYNTTFEFACLRLAQVAYDIQFSGSPVVFSWPSQGTLSGYGADQNSAASSGAQLGQLLIDLNKGLSEQGAGRIHVIAHSMGNRIMLAAISILNQHVAAKDSRIGHIIMAAPDVEQATFVANFPAARKLAASVSLYFCDKDLALDSSQIAHLTSRLGQQALFYEGLINIDASRADTSILGHGYFAAQSLLLIDIEEALDGEKPDDRRTIRRAVFTSPEIPQPNVYWLFP
jgi:esterase/lipase superfamily enzyme